MQLSECARLLTKIGDQQMVIRTLVELCDKKILSPDQKKIVDEARSLLRD